MEREAGGTVTRKVRPLTVKKVFFAIFPSPAGMSLTKFPLRESLVSDIPAGDGKIVNLFLKCCLLSTALARIGSSPFSLSPRYRTHDASSLPFLIVFVLSV